MPETLLPLSEYQGMWLFALFDLPVTSKEHKKHYVEFRRILIKQGFMMMQYSVYARYCASEEYGGILKKKLKAGLPPDGEVRLLMVTDRQFGKMECFSGKKSYKPEGAPEQMMLF